MARPQHPPTDSRQRACAIAGVFIILALALAPAVALGVSSATHAPQVTTPSGGSGGPDAPAPTPASSNTTATNNSGNGGGLFQGPIIPPKMKQKAAQTALGSVINFSISYVPVTGAHPLQGDFTWDRFPYDSLGWVSLLSMASAISLCIVGAFVNTARLASPLHQNSHRHIRMALRAFGAIIIGIALYRLIVSLGYTAVGDLARGIGPSPSELTASLAGFLKFGTMTAFAVGSLAQLGWDVAKYLGISYAVTWGLLVFLALLGPPFYVGALYFRGTSTGRFCSTVVRMHIVLTLTPVIQALLVAGAFRLNWEANFNGFMAVIMSQVLLMIAIFVPLLMVIIAFFSRGRAVSFLTMGASSIMGSTIAAKAAGRAREKKDQKKKEYKERATDYTANRAKSTKQRAKGAYRKQKYRGDRKYVDTDADPNTDRQAMAEHVRQSSDSSGGSSDPTASRTADSSRISKLRDQQRRSAETRAQQRAENMSADEYQRGF